MLISLILLFALSSCDSDSDKAITKNLTSNFTESGLCGDKLHWYYKDGSLVITGTGEMDTFKYSSDIPWYEYMDEIETVIINNGCTSISQAAFYDCRNLTRLTLPDSIVSIGASAFANCGIGSVYIPADLEYSGDKISLAFYGCPIKEFTVSSDNESYIARDGVLFSAIHELVCYPSASDNIVYEVPDDTVRIMGYAFRGCKNLVDIVIPENSTFFIGASSFYECESLMKINIPEGVDTISSYAFYGCTNLSSVTLPQTLVTIEDFAFSNCGNLKEVTIPSGVENIGENCFKNTELTMLSYTGNAQGYPWGASIE